MELQKHQLPDFLLADLYRHSIVLVGEELSVAIEKPAVEKQVIPEIPVLENLVTAKPLKEKKEKPLPPPVQGEWWLGNNQKKITIVVKEEGARYLKDDSLQFLSSILGACKLNLGDVAIVNYDKDPVSYAQLKEKLSPSCLILFDTTAKQVQLSFTVPFYQVQNYDSCQFLLAPSLEKMLGTEQDAKLEKSKLWLCLKKMFGIQ